MRAEGWDLKAYNSNPIILFSHNGSLPVGTSKVWLEGKQLMTDINLAESGTAPVVDYVRGLVRQKILRAVSVGFLPTAEPKYIRDAETECDWFRVRESGIARDQPRRRACKLASVGGGTAIEVVR